jgi:Zn-dependent M16 (insulinase) family peptidase
MCACVCVPRNSTIPVVGVGVQLVSHMGCGSMDHKQVTQAINLHTGGIDVSPVLTPDPQDASKFQKRIHFSSHALQRNVPDMMALVNSVLKEPNFTDYGHLATLIQMVGSVLHM